MQLAVKIATSKGTQLAGSYNSLNRVGDTVHHDTITHAAAKQGLYDGCLQGHSEISSPNGIELIHADSDKEIAHGRVHHRTILHGR